MALFKILKGSQDQLGAGSSSTRYAKEGYAYFATKTENGETTGKMYIDIAGNGTATPAEIGTNRIPLNAEKADYAESAKRDENGDRILVSYVKVDVSDSELGNENLINADSLGGSPANDYLLKTSAINLIYPVGSIYITFSEENPATLFGVGTWTKIEGKFLLGASSSYVNG